MRQWTTKNNGYKVYRLLFHISNVFLIVAGSKTILVDTSNRYCRKRIKRKLDQLHITHIDYLILTHTHYDHASNARFIQDTYGAKVIAHEEGIDALRNGCSQVPQGTIGITRLVSRFVRKYINRRLDYGCCEPDIILKDSFHLQQEGVNIRIIHTPGHSADSVSILVDDEIAIAGDALFGVFPHSVFPPFADDIPCLVASWQKLLATPARLYLPAHGFEKRKNRFEKQSRKRRLALDIDKPSF